MRGDWGERLKVCCYSCDGGGDANSIFSSSLIILHLY